METKATRERRQKREREHAKRLEVYRRWRPATDRDGNELPGAVFDGQNRRTRRERTVTIADKTFVVFRGQTLARPLLSTPRASRRLIRRAGVR